MRIFIAAAALTFALISTATRFPDAPTGFDNKTNGIVDDVTHQADQAKFEGVEQLTDGRGPLYNAQSCRRMSPEPCIRCGIPGHGITGRPCMARRTLPHSRHPDRSRAPKPSPGARW